MAQMSLRSKIQEDHLTCSICFEIFNTPKALPCIHTFCLGCLQEYVSTQRTDMGTFPCPMCKQNVQIPPNGIQGFPDNHLLASLSDTVDSSSPRVPPRPSPTAIEEAKGRLSPKPPPTRPEIPPRPKSVSPTPGAQAGHSRPNVSFGAMISGSIGGVVGSVGTAISDISSHFYPQKPQPPANRVPESPFEIVSRLSNPGNGLYPQLPDISEKVPCSHGMLSAFWQYGSSVNDFMKPFGLAVGHNGEYFISDLAGNRVLVFSNDGELKHRFNLDCVVRDVTVTKDNQLLIAVCNSGTAIMRLYTFEGKLLRQFGDFYRFDRASGIVNTISNHVVITNTAADNVLVFTDQRKFSVKFGSKGSGERHFMQPQFVTSTRKDYIVVSDTGNNCIKIFDNSGNFKRSFGQKGDQHGQLDKPLGIATDAHDNIIIADSNNFRVEIFTVKGMFYSTLVKDTNRIGGDVRPINVAVTPRNNVVVLLSGTGYAEVRIYNWQPSVSCGDGFSVI